MSSAAYQSRYRKDRYLVGYRRMDATGARRRLQALSRMGWSMSSVAKATGLHVAFLQRILNGNPGDRVNTKTHTAIAGFYSRHGMDQVNHPTANRLRILAARKGWVSPLAWDDIDNVCEKPYGSTDFLEMVHG